MVTPINQTIYISIAYSVLTIDIVFGEINVLVITIVGVVERLQVRQYSGPTDQVRL